jgi:tRNA uridine 5-carboxymethylaminomethyl modification enzyme
MTVNADGNRRSALELLARPDVGFGGLERLWPELREFSAGARLQVETDAKYSVYLGRQEAAVADYSARLEARLPADLDYSLLPGLSNEIKNRLSAARPASLEHAYRVEGMTPAAMTLLAAYARRVENAGA